MNTLVRCTVCAVLCFLLALPAAADAQATSIQPLAIGWASAPQLGSVNGGPRAALLRLQARRTAATAHFNFPYAVASDGAGNVLVANTDGNYIKKINSALSVTGFKITQHLASPISIAIDSAKNIYAGNGGGGIEKYASNGVHLATITANASFPVGIAVDQFQDIFVTSSAGLAVDDSAGNSIFSNIYSPGSQLFSVTLGGPNVYTFYDANVAFGNGSVALRLGNLQFTAGPLPTKEPLGSVCNSGGVCWFDDTAGNTLSFATFPGSPTTVALPYSPAGMAYEPIHNRLFVADPTDNAVQVYNPSTLALIQTIR